MKPIEHSTPFDQIRAMQDVGRRVLFIPNPGNHGDALITAATVQNFEKYRINYHVPGRRFEHLSENLYVYAGGGNLIPSYDSCSSVLRSLSKLKAELIILPHSCYGVTDQIAGYEGKISIWARDRNTHDYLSRISAKQLQYGLADDVALSLRLEDQRFYYFHMSRMLNSFRADQIPSKAILQAFRQDKESNHPTLPFPNVRNFDLSSAYPRLPPASRGFDIGFLDQRLLFGYASWFLSWIDQFDTIYTDRLHIGIAATLLGKNVHLYDNNYGKVRSIYEYSLKERPGARIVTHWRDD